jgi:hypothetical protein
MTVDSNIIPQLVELLASTRGVKVQIEGELTCFPPPSSCNVTNLWVANESHPLKAIETVSKAIKDAHPRESEALQSVLAIAEKSPDFGGLGLSQDAAVSDVDRGELVFLSSAWLEALNSLDRGTRVLTPVSTKPAGRRPMNVTEKIFSLHDVESKGWVKPGQMIRVAVDWIMASEFSWHVSTIRKCYIPWDRP